jgi:hypothetical protein
VGRKPHFDVRCGEAPRAAAAAATTAAATTTTTAAAAATSAATTTTTTSAASSASYGWEGRSNRAEGNRVPDRWATWPHGETQRLCLRCERSRIDLHKSLQQDASGWLGENQLPQGHRQQDLSALARSALGSRPAQVLRSWV